MKQRKKSPALLRRERQEWFRVLVQVGFFLLAPSVYASAFTAVKSCFSSLGQGLPLEWSAFAAQLLLLLGFTVLFGRFFCGWACAFGALGDWVYRFSQWAQKKTRRTLPRLSERMVRGLQWVKYGVLVLILALCFAGHSALVSRNSPWTVFSLLRSLRTDVGSNLMGCALFVLILVGMSVQERFFCQFLCPMGAVFALLPQFPFFSLRRKVDACPPNCGACRKLCPAALLLDEENPRQGECFRCGRCSCLCPRQNLSTCGGLRGDELWLDGVKGAVLLGLLLWLN